MGTLAVQAWRRFWGSRLVTLNGWVAVDLPKAVTAVGVSLLLGIVGTHGYVLGTQAVPTYFVVYTAILAAGCLTAVVGVVWGANAAIAQRGWFLGSIICLLFSGVYLASRLISLPGLETLTGRWDIAPGTFALAFAAGFLGVHATVLSGINIAYPQHQEWHD